MFDCGDFTLPTSSSSALTKQARWMALAGKTTQTVSSWLSQNAPLFCNCVLGVTATGCPVTFLPFIFTAWLSYLLSFIAVHIGYPMVPSLLSYLCCVYSIIDALLSREYPGVDLCCLGTAGMRKLTWGETLSIIWWCKLGLERKHP